MIASLEPRRRGNLLAVVLLTLPLAGLPSPSFGESLDLPTAMRRARENALQVEAAKARRDASAARADQARGYRLPRISFQEMYLYTDSPADSFALQLNKKEFSFPDFVGGDPNNPDANGTAISRFELELPIWAGGEIGTRIDQAEHALSAAQDRADRAADEAALGAAEGYVMLAQAREHVELLQRALETVDAHVNLAEAFVDQGMLVRSELLRAQVERARIADLLSEARGNAKVAEANLAFQMGATGVPRWELEALSPPPALDEPLAAYLDRAESRLDLSAAREMIEAARLEAKAQNAKRLPHIGVLARYDFVDEDPFGTGADSFTISAMASIDLWSGGRHAAAREAARAEAEAGARDVERFAEAIRLQVRQAWERAQTARERHATALSALEAAREAERITEARFEKGIVKMIDLLDASTARREAEARELMARADAHLRGLQLAVQSGQAPESALSPPSQDDATTENQS